MQLQQTNTFEQKLIRRTLGVVFVGALKGIILSLFSLMVFFYLLLIKAYFLPALFAIHLSAKMIFVLLGVVPVLIGVLIGFLHARNKRKLTLTLEEHYPHLRERLLTLVEISEKHEVTEAHPFSRLLAQELEDEMSLLMERFGFGRAASFEKLLKPIGLILLIFLCGTVHAMVQPDFFPTSYSRLTAPLNLNLWKKSVRDMPLPQFEMQVTPGHCEIPRGSNLLIQVRVLDYLPKKVELYIKKSQDAAWLIFPMDISKGTRGNEYQYLVPHINDASDYYIKADHQETEVFKIKLFEALQLERAVWRLEFPEYTKIPEQRRQGWREKITVPRGTKIFVELHFNQPISKGQIEVKNGSPIPLIRKGKRVMETHFSADKDFYLTLSVESLQKEILKGLPSLWIQTLPDLAPYLEVLEPMLHNYVFPTQEVPFELSINDDYGIKSVTLVIRYQGKEERLNWMPEGKFPDSIVLKPVLDLERFNLESRDLVFAYIEVDDNFPEEPRHIVRSPMFVFLIRDYVEQYKLNAPPPDLPALRILFEDLLVEQEKVMQDTWDYMTAPKTDGPTGWEMDLTEAQNASAR